MLGDIDLTLKKQEHRSYLCKPDKTVIAELSESYNKKLITKYNALHEFSFTLPYSIEKNKQYVRNDHVDQLRGHYYIRLDVVDNDDSVLNSDYFYITKPKQSANDGIETLQVQCYLSPYALRQKTVRNYTGTKTLEQALTETLLVKSNWKIGHIDEEIESIYRTFDESQRNLLDFIYQLAETFDAVVVWDTINETVSFYKNENLGQDKGLSIEYGKYLKTIDEDPDFDNVVTRLICEGNDGLSIQRLNPTGANYLEDLSYYLYPFERDENKNVLSHSYYMSDELCHAQLDYEELLKSKEPIEKSAEVGTTVTNIKITNHGLSNGDYIENITKDAVRKVTVVDVNNFTVASVTNQVPTDKILLYPTGTFGKLFFQKEDYQAQLTTLENQMQDLVNELSIILDNLDVANANGDSTASLITQRENKEIEIDAKQTQIDVVEANISNVDGQLSSLYAEISVGNNFTAEQLIERNSFEIENVWVDTNYTNDEDLYNDGLKKLKAVSQPRINYSIDIVDFMSVIECQREWGKLVLGDIVTVRYPNFGIDIQAKMIEITQGLDEHSIALTIANAKDIDNGFVKVQEILNNAARSSTTVDLSKMRWDAAVEETSTINEIINSTWSAVEKEIKAGINESVSVSGRGIVLTNPDDPSKMIILQHGLIALSEDSGNTWKTAIQPSGITAEVIRGKLGQFVEIDADVIVAGSPAYKLETVDGSQEKLNNFVDEVLDPTLVDLQAQLNEKVFTWFFDYVPTNNNYPTSDWIEKEVQSEHVGNLFYNTLTGYCYRYTEGFIWEQIQDQDIIDAISQASEARSVAEDKRRVFVSQPSPPYNIGDLWRDTATPTDLKICTKERLSGSFSSSDWELATDMESHVVDESPHNLPSYCKMESDGIKVYDSLNELRCHMGQYDTGKYGLKITNGQIFSSRIRSGAEGSGDYVEIGSGLSPLGVVVGNKKVLEIFYYEHGGIIYFNDTSGSYKGSLGAESGGLFLESYPGCVSLMSHRVDIEGTKSGTNIYGGLYVSGTKDAVVRTKNYGRRHLSARESPESRFIEEGFGVLENGECTVQLDPVYLETIEPNTDEALWYIQLTEYDDFDIYVDEVGEDYFIVKEKKGGTSNGKFAWSLSAVRIDFKGRRLIQDAVDDEVMDSNWEDVILEGGIE